jgi:hypothetical protein
MEITIEHNRGKVTHDLTKDPEGNVTINIYVTGCDTVHGDVVNIKEE